MATMGITLGLEAPQARGQARGAETTSYPCLNVSLGRHQRAPPASGARARDRVIVAGKRERTGKSSGSLTVKKKKRKKTDNLVQTAARVMVVDGGKVGRVENRRVFNRRTTDSVTFFSRAYFLVPEVILDEDE